MPTWSFVDHNHSDAQFDKFFKSYDDMVAWVEANPGIEQVPGMIAPAIVDPIRLGVTKPAVEFRERLKQIAKGARHNKMNTQ